MANLTIEGQGTFNLNPEQVQALLGWLEQNGVAKTINNEGSDFEGNTLLNEGDKGTPLGNPKANIKPDGSGTYDFGGTWL